MSNSASRKSSETSSADSAESKPSLNTDSSSTDTKTPTEPKRGAMSGNPVNPAYFYPNYYQTSLEGVAVTATKGIPSGAINPAYQTFYNTYTNHNHSNPNAPRPALTNPGFYNYTGDAKTTDRGLSKTSPTSLAGYFSLTPSTNAPELGGYLDLKAAKGRARKASHIANNQHSIPPNLNDHNTKGSADRPYACAFEECPWSFARQSDLRRHVKSHIEPAFHCPYWKNDPTCHRNGGAFNRLDVLKRHLKLVHYVPDKGRSGVSEEVCNSPTESQIVKTGGSNHVHAGKDDPGWCRACQQMFPASRQFVDHSYECASSLTPAEWKVHTGKPMYAIKPNSLLLHHVTAALTAAPDHTPDDAMSQAQDALTILAQGLHDDKSRGFYQPDPSLPLLGHRGKTPPFIKSEMVEGLVSLESVTAKPKKRLADALGKGDAGRKLVRAK